jgi:hypothetical protein
LTVIASSQDFFKMKGGGKTKKNTRLGLAKVEEKE